MGTQCYRNRLDRLLFLIQHQQMLNAPLMAKKLGYHKSTLERQLKRLRAEGHLIHYDAALKRYVLEEESGIRGQEKN